MYCHGQGSLLQHLCPNSQEAPVGRKHDAVLQHSIAYSNQRMHLHSGQAADHGQGKKGREGAGQGANINYCCSG
jgi:hypothetical protein